MTEQWIDCLLGDVITLKRGYDLPTRNRKKGDHPVVSSSGITDSHDTAKVDAPGVVTGRYGTLGEVFYITKDFWPLNTSLYVKDFKGNYPRYIYYFLQIQNLRQQNVAGAVPGVNRNYLHKLPVKLPPLPTQHKIAAVLSAYDDLIENNTRRIEILEEMARTIYREWFVEFHFPGHEDVEMIDSELGPIPEGWEIKSVDELLKYHIGGSWGKDEPEGDFNVPVYIIRGTDIPGARQMIFDECPLRYLKQSYYDSRELISGDVIFEVSGGSKDQPVGRALLVSQRLIDEFDEKVICASFCKLLRANDEYLLPILFYLHLGDIYRNREINQYQVQSTGIKNFKFSHFLSKHFIVVPDRAIQIKFQKVLAPVYELVNVLGIQSQNLRQTRDLLLPKLVSGEIEVNND